MNDRPFARTLALCLLASAPLWFATVAALSEPRPFLAAFLDDYDGWPRPGLLLGAAAPFAIISICVAAAVAARTNRR